jgi:hypothetical protein
MSNRIDRKTKPVGESKIVIVFLTVMLCLVGTTLTQNSASAAGLFSDAPAYADLDTKLEQVLEDATVVGVRPVQVDLDSLAGENLPEGAESIILNLFDDLSLVAVKDRLERRSDTIYTWFGSIEGGRHSSAIIVVADASVAANITVDGQMYQVRDLGDGIHAIREIDQSMFPDESPPIEVALPPGPPLDPGFQGDDGSIIDVMVVYTAELAGHVPGLATEILLAIDETNQSYANSGITQRINLVHTAQVTYTESDDLCTDLGRLRGTADGYMDNVHALRDQYCADLVSLWTWSGGACGCGYFMDPVSSGFEAWAFSTVKRNCATGYYSFGHEFGHNMSAHHDCYAESDITPYPYNHGYVCHPERVRTIMAYNSECADSGYNCTRIQYWSNPNTAYGNCPVLGVPESGSDCTSENWRTLNNTALTVANFRDSTVCVPVACQPPACTPPGDEYCSTDVPKPIPDLTTITSTLTIAQACTIVDLNVELDITHTYDGDLDVYLIGPDATRVELLTDVGASGNNFECTVLDDEAATPISASAAPFTNCYQPEGSLADFDGKNISGTWTLEITDDVAADVGTLDSWCLIVETSCGTCWNPTECGGQPLGDVNCDGCINVLDLGLMKPAFFSCEGDVNYNCCADLNHDECVNFIDLGTIKASFFSCGHSPATGNQACPP